MSIKLSPFEILKILNPFYENIHILITKKVYEDVKSLD